MALLLNNTNQIREVLPVSGTLKWEDIAPFVKKAEQKYIVKAIGQNLYDALLVAIDDNEVSDSWAELILRCKRAIAYFAVLDYIPMGQLKVSSAGIQISSDEKNKTAFKWQIQDLQQDCSKNGYAALDSVFVYLEENIDEFDVYWSDTDGYTLTFENYIHNADVFTKNVSMLGGSRSIFLQLKPFMADVEQQLVINLLGADEDATLRAAAAGTPTNAQKQALLLIQRMVAYKTMAKALMILALRIDDRGVFVFDATQARDTNAVEKTADDAAIEKRIKYFETEANAQEQLLVKYLNANSNEFSDYAAMVAANTSTGYTPQTTDRVINFMNNG